MRRLSRGQPHLLGSVEEFYGLLADGAVVRLGRIDGKNLQRVVNLSDGQKIEWPK